MVNLVGPFQQALLHGGHMEGMTYYILALYLPADKPFHLLYFQPTL